MLLWRSFWNLFTLSFTNTMSYSLIFAGSTLILMVLGCFNSVLGNPSSVVLDNTSEYCIISTLFSNWATNSLARWKVTMIRMVDAISTIVVEVLNILLWYSVDGYNQVVLPSPPEVSRLTQCVIPMALGLGFGLAALYTQIILVSLVEGRRGDMGDERGGPWQDGKRRMAHWVISSIGLVSSILHWYGLWTMLDYFFIPTHPMLSNLVTAGVGIAGLCLTGASRLVMIMSIARGYCSSFRSLHGGVARDGHVDDPYPIQPYFFLAFINWS